MTRMNRREFITIVGGVSVVSVAGMRPVLAEGTTTPLFVKGLVMVSFEDPKVLRLGFPKAPGHKATLSVVPVLGDRKTLSIKGNGTVEAVTMSAESLKVFVPELIRMKEFYGDAVRSKIADCPSVISIPYSAIQSISTHEVSKDRYTFLRADNGQEVNSFRPRKIADTIRIELSSSSVLKINGGKVSVPMKTAHEVWADYSPEEVDRYPDMYADHFVHYFEYIERPPAADFLVVPKKISGSTGTTPRIGNNFLRFGMLAFCYMVAVP